VRPRETLKGSADRSQARQALVAQHRPRRQPVHAPRSAARAIPQPSTPHPFADLAICSPGSSSPNSQRSSWPACGARDSRARSSHPRTRRVSPAGTECRRSAVGSRSDDDARSSGVHDGAAPLGGLAPVPCHGTYSLAWTHEPLARRPSTDARSHVRQYGAPALDDR
jgi:hypothetical protein